MSDFEDVDGFQTQLSDLQLTLGDTTAMTVAFDAELARVRDSMMFTGRQVSSLSTSFGSGLRRAFDGLVFDGAKLSDSLEMVARSMADAAYNTAMKPVQNALGGVIANGMNTLLSGVFGFSHGGAFTQGRVMPFAKGGVVTAPTTFPMRGATGLMGEAGPEAIMPLTRGADGRLGVRAQGGAQNVTINIQTPDVAGFQRSRAQVSAQLARAVRRGQGGL